MRKGSTKKTQIPTQPIERPDSILEYDKTHALALPSIQKEVLNILLRLCDACHEMDTRTEPWASIRKDIEELR